MVIFIVRAWGRLWVDVDCCCDVVCPAVFRVSAVIAFYGIVVIVIVVADGDF
jgi:hypothetical protein